MTESLLLDTHVWLWLSNGLLSTDAALLSRLRVAASEQSIFVSAISFYEIANALHRGRLDLRRSLDDWFAANLGQPGVRVIEITPAIAIETTMLPSTFHGDPGDRLIAATARLNQLTLVTHDKALLRFGQQGLYQALKASPKGIA